MQKILISNLKFATQNISLIYHFYSQKQISKFNQTYLKGTKPDKFNEKKQTII